MNLVGQQTYYLFIERRKMHRLLNVVLICILASVGKSCMLLRYVDGTYTDDYISTIGADYVRLCKKKLSFCFVVELN